MLRPISARAQNCQPERSEGSAFCRRAAINRYHRQPCSGAACCAPSRHERKIVSPSAARDLLSADAPRSTATTDDLVVAQHAAPHLGTSAKLSSRAQRGICFLPTHRDQPLPPTTL